MLQLGPQPVQVAASYGLYPYQRQVLRDLSGYLGFEDGNALRLGNRVIVHMPTGSGKTRVACHAACDLLNRAKSDESLVVWLASTEELCDQAAVELQKAWSFLGNREIAVHRYWGGMPDELHSAQGGFLVAGLAKLWAASGRDVRLMRNLAENTAAVIFDEAHQSIAPTYRYIIEQLLSYDPPLLGLTATPGRTAPIADPDFNLAEMFGANKVTIDPRGHTSPVSFLIRHGYLADPEFIPMEVESELVVSPPNPGFDYSNSQLSEIGGDENWRNATSQITLAALRAHQRVMVFCSSVATVKSCALAVRAAGLAAEVVLGETPDAERRESIARFKSSASERIALINYGVLTAGFDAPKTRCVVVARPTTSLVLYSQMVGRAMRGPRFQGNRTCQIFTVVDSNLPGFGSVVEMFANWEELWNQA